MITSDDLDRLMEARATESLATFVPRRSAPESLLRASLMPLLGQVIGGEGVAGRLGAMPLKVTIEPSCALTGAAAPLLEISEGAIGISSEVKNDE